MLRNYSCRIRRLARSVALSKPQNAIITQIEPLINQNINAYNFHTQPTLCNTISEEQMTEKLDKEEELIDKILDAALKEVLTHGWHMSAVSSAVQQLGYPAVTAGLVDNIDQLVLHHIKSSNKKLDTWMEAEVKRLTADGQRLPITKFIRSCIVTRLSMNIPYIEAGVWSEGVARVCGSAEGVCQGVETWQQVCDDIWYRAGDTSHDMSWYTKRLSLAAVMATTDVFMVQDSSDNYQDTWDFLDRRLDDLALVPTFTKIPEDAAKVAEGIFQTAKILVGAQR